MIISVAPPHCQIGLGDCLDLTWEVTDSFFGGSHGVPADERCRINRAYARVSRDKMQANLKARLAAAGVDKITGRVDAKTVRLVSLYLVYSRWRRIVCCTFVYRFALFFPWEVAFDARVVGACPCIQYQ